MPSLAGKVCLVTGATRGIGKGIALQLAEKGAKVYITGRTLDPPKDSKVGGSLRDTAREIEARGGSCIPVQCDHSKDSDIKNLFDKISRENDGQIDVLVNNAYSAVNAIFASSGKKFWELEPDMWDTVNNVGLRNHYICSVYAARLMVPRKQGLIVNISSGGGLRYLFNVAYGVGKEACDRMAADCGIELQGNNVAFVSLWPGPVQTEVVMDKFGDPNNTQNSQVSKMFQDGETVEFSGQCIAALATDPNIMKMTGKILWTYDLGKRYGLKDEQGREPMNMASVKVALNRAGRTWLAKCVPAFISFPKWMVALQGNKL